MRGVPTGVMLLLAPILLAACIHLSPLEAHEIRHVFLIVLENKDHDETFGAHSPAPYLGHTLPGMGRLLPNYYGIGRRSLVNYLALVSGQPPNEETSGNCGTYSDMQDVTVTDGVARGAGCVFPAEVPTVADQLEGAGRSWRMYAEDMSRTPPTSCRHPPSGEHDPWQSANTDDQYATKHVPFVYFHSVVDDSARCSDHVVDLASLDEDLRSEETTPNYVFVTPDLCSDGHDAPCPDGRPGGYASMNAFLEDWVPRILKSPAYQSGGLLVVTFDESEAANPSGACCEPDRAWGGRVGAVLVSPCIEPGSRDDSAYDHFGLLRAVEDVFGLAPLGLARDTAAPFSADECAK